MAHQFDPAVVDAVLAHMNDDHLDDNLLIVRAAGDTEATAASMSGLDGEAGTWTVIGPEGPVGERRIPWPGGPITERAEIRREVVVLYEQACAQLGVEPRPH
ncbi:uncharacterized protein DUF2470 [Nocardioides sp. J9]|uniref:DUF2470 domain-containing protein n=1 Tax=unclassified Nocardioides TaxID=2615069 RepID=UPI00048F1B8C|nr:MULTISPECIES: DUF2470 domain-containing protein [unclassified Nocardioides]TWH04687.1 uncharacterized protein DUF2470 [Nocardioides sp. J9]